MMTVVITKLAKVAPSPIHCIPHGSYYNSGETITLCGWAGEVSYYEEEAVPDCPDCLAVVAYCKALEGVPEPPT